MALSVSCTCCALVRASAEYCGYLCYPSAVKRLWPLWSNPEPLSIIRYTCVVPLFLRCYVIRHMVLIALECEKVLRLPPRSYCLYNWISHFRFDKWQSPRAMPFQRNEQIWEELVFHVARGWSRSVPMNRMNLTYKSCWSKPCITNCTITVIDRHSSYKQNCTNQTHKKGILERIVKPPFSYVIAWSSTLHWVWITSGSWTLTVSKSGNAYQGIPVLGEFLKIVHRIHYKDPVTIWSGWQLRQTLSTRTEDTTCSDIGISHVPIRTTPNHHRDWCSTITWPP